MIRTICFGILILFFVSSPANAQSFVPDAVLRIFNVTFSIGSTTSIAATQTTAFLTTNDAVNANVGNNAVFIQDVCSTSFHPCHSDATCTDINGTLGIIQCKCNSGFNQTASTRTEDLANGTAIIPDGTNCPDIDECAGNTTVCGAGTDQCFNSAGSYSCNCTSGYDYDNTTRLCNDINECNNDSLNNCHQNATCTNTEGGFNCSCDDGFSGNGVNCTEINECTTRNITCGGNGQCQDPAGARYSCNCNNGYSENTNADPRTCDDLDECQDGSNTCDDNAQCTNNQGSFTCACNNGYTGDGTNCQDTDECANNPCDANATCTNSAGSFSCACNDGFTGNGTVCRAASQNFCYRLSITFNEATTGDTTSRANDADTAVTGFLNELENGNVGFSNSNYTYTFEAVLGNNTVTEFIIDLCLNESSQSPAELTSTLQNFTFTTTINNQAITVLEYNECITNYGNCSDNADCTNTDGDFYCTCRDTHVDRSTSGVNGTICDLPTNFTCSSNTVNVTAYNPYFENLGINYTELFLGTCSGTLQGDDILYAGDCGALVESNDTHLFYKWNLTNVNESSDVTIGNFVTIPITCTFLSSQNVSFNISAERRDIVFDDDLNNLPGQAYDFSVDAFSDSTASTRLSGAVNTNTKIYFRLGTSNTLPSNVTIQCESFSTSAADGSSSSLQLMRNGCSVPQTNSNRRIVQTLDIVRNGATSSAIVGVTSHFFGTSRLTVARFVVNACVGSDCQYNCNSRRRRAVITYRFKRETVGSGEVQFAFERAPGDDCTKDCNLGGICVFDTTLNEQCVCADGFTYREDGTCRPTVTETTTVGGETNSTVPLNITMIILIALAIFMVLLVAVLLFVFLFRRTRRSSKDYGVSSGHANTNESFKME